MSTESTVSGSSFESSGSDSPTVDTMTYMYRYAAWTVAIGVSLLLSGLLIRPESSWLATISSTVGGIALAITGLFAIAFFALICSQIAAAFGFGSEKRISCNGRLTLIQFCRATCGVFVGSLVVFVPLVAATKAQGQTWSPTTALIAGVCLIAFDLLMSSLTTKWPSAIRGAGSLRNGLVAGFGTAGAWTVIGCAFWLLGAIQAANRDDKHEFKFPQVNSKSRVGFDQRSAATQGYWRKTMFRLLEPSTPESPNTPLPGETIGEMFQRTTSLVWLEEIENAARMTTNVDKDLIAQVAKHVADIKRANQTFRDVFSATVTRNAKDDALQSARESSEMLVQAIQEHQFGPDATLFDVMPILAEQSGDPRKIEAANKLREAMMQVESDIDAALELRGRLSERYPGRKFPLPGDDDSAVPVGN